MSSTRLADRATDHPTDPEGATAGSSAARPPASPWSFRIGLGLATLAAFVIRLITLETVAERTPGGLGDPSFYHLQANMLVDGLGFSEPFRWTELGIKVPSASHPPLFTLWLAIPSALGFDSWYSHKVMSCLAGTLTVAVVGLVGREVAGARAGVIAAALCAAYPNLWMIDGILFPEGLFTLTIGLVILFAYRWRRSGHWGWAAALGVAVGLSALARGEGILLAGLLLIPLVVWRPHLERTERVRQLGIMVLGVVAVVAPWTIRNTLQFNNVVPLSNNSNELIFYANCPESYYGTFTGFWSFNCQERYRQQFGEPPGDESDKALFWRERGIEYARDNLDRLPTVAAARVGRVWDFYAPFQNAEFTKLEGRTEWVSEVGVIYYWALWPAAAYGVVSLIRRKVSVVPLVVMAVLVTVTALYAYGAIRFRTPADIGLLVLAGIGADAVIRRLRGESGVRSPQEAWSKQAQTHS